MKASSIWPMVLCGVVASLLWTRVRADDSAQLQHALDFSRKFMFEHHLVAEVRLESREAAGPKEEFTYDRYPDVERIKVGDDKVFAKKTGGKWLKSNDWAETGVPVPAKKAADLDFDVQIALIAWSPSHSSKDTTQGATSRSS